MPQRSFRTYIKEHAGELLWLLVPTLGMLAYNLACGRLVELGPDARLYLSIADNFCATGHFIQTARPVENFVVPFGVPLILTVFRLLRLPVEGIIVLQHLMLGTTCLLLRKTERILFGRGGFAPAFYCTALLRAQLNPNNIYLEHYFLLLLAVLLYLSVRTDMPVKKRLTLMNLAGVTALAVRPVLAPVYAAVLVYSLVLLVRRKLPAGRFVLFLLIPAVLFGANTLVNHRETGHWVFMDTYSGSDLYYANNPGASTGYYQRSDQDAFPEEYFEVLEDDTLGKIEKNERFKDMALRWICENPGTFLKNTLLKFVEDFGYIWRGVLVVCFLGALHMIAASPARRRWTVVTLLLNFVVAFITAMGLVMTRYTIVVWPLAALHLAALIHAVLRRGKRILSGKRTI